MLPHSLGLSHIPRAPFVLAALIRWAPGPSAVSSRPVTHIGPVVFQTRRRSRRRNSITIRSRRSGEVGTIRSGRSWSGVTGRDGRSWSGVTGRGGWSWKIDTIRSGRSWSGVARRGGRSWSGGTNRNGRSWRRRICSCCYSVRSTIWRGDMARSWTTTGSSKVRTN